MLISTSSSGITRSNAGYRAEMAFVSVLFACSAIVLRNGRDNHVPSMIPNSLDSLGKSDLSHSHSLAPQGLLYAFFFLYALEGQITECKNDQQYMPTPTGPASALMVIQAQLFLQLLVSLFNPKPFMKGSGMGVTS